MKFRQSILTSLLVISLLFFGSNQIFGKGGKMTMWYDNPAQNWNEALPVGNGRIGAMVFGNPANERIQLNEETFWSGGPSRNDNPDALKALPEIRKLIFEGKNKDAENLINETIRAKELHGSKYQVIGDLKLLFPDHQTYEEYYRDLNLEKAVSSTTYKVNGVEYKREVFASFPDEVMVVRLSASKPGMLTFTAQLDGPLKKSVKTLNDNTIEMAGLSENHEGVTGQVKFNTLARILNKGGKTSAVDGKIEISGANEVVILVSMATNFVDYKTLTANESEKCAGFLKAAEKKSYENLLADHMAMYGEMFNRVKIDLGETSASNRPTVDRIRDFSKSNDPELVAMYFQFGRYLLISSSQPGCQPANLQGIWNESTNPAWDSKYTININAEMNYWPAEKCNLSELHEPLIQMIRELSETGKETAKVMYDCDGWVAHHNTDIWRITGMIDGAFWGMWPMGGAWLSEHLWEKYLYGGDLEYLESVYPIMKSACEFYVDFLIEEPINKWLVVSPSVSPENVAAGKSTSVTAGATMDNQILTELFSNTMAAARLLKKDQEIMGKYQEILDRLPPMQIGKHGQLQEWMEDLDNPEDKHRHVSHLYGLYPSNQITPYASPELFDAARTTLIQRGDVSTGWSMGWKVNFWARLLDGNHAYKMITDQLTLVEGGGRRGGGGTYPNFFDSHPPFQIDGNFGCTSGITEMLMQSHDGAIHIIPALPDAWKNGEITGLRTIGGFEVSFVWKDSKVEKLIVKSTLGGNCRIRLPNEIALDNGKKIKEAKGDNPNPFFASAKIKEPIISEEANLKELNIQPTMLYDISTKKGEIYTFVIKK